MIDSGSVSSQVIRVRYTSNAASAAGDSVRVAYTNACHVGANKSVRLNNLVTAAPRPASITITAVSPNACGARIYRYAAPALTVSNSTTASATGYQWSFVGALSLYAVIDSGTVNSRVIRVRFTTNAAAGFTDSIRVRYNSSCGFGANRSARLTNTALTGCPPPSSKLPVVAEPQQELAVNVFPNPTPSTFNVVLKGKANEPVEVRVLDIQGRYLKTVRTAANQTLNLGADLRAGSYLIEVRQGNNVKTMKVLKL